MIFRDYSVIIYLNALLAVILFLSFLYLALLDARYRRLEERKRSCFERWEGLLIRTIVHGEPFDPGACHRYDWFAEFISRWYVSFRGEVIAVIGRVCADTGLLGKMEQAILRGGDEARLTALRFFVVSGIIPSAGLKERLVTAIRPPADIAGLLELRLAARLLGPERPVDIIRALAASAFLSPTMQLEILRELLPTLRERFDESLAACRQDESARILLLEAAGRLWMTEASPALRDIFRAAGGEDKIRAMRSLAALHCDDMKEEIYAHYREEQRPVMQTLAFKSFLALADEHDISRIASELDDRNWFVRYSAAKALARLGAAGLAALHARPDHDACALALAERGDTADNHHEHIHVR